MTGLFKEMLKYSFRNNNLQILGKCYCTQNQSSNIKDAPGLSKKVLDVPKNEVGPGASKKSVYKNPEYFCYHSGSYFEAEVEMLKYRLPQPGNKSVEKK